MALKNVQVAVLIKKADCPAVNARQLFILFLVGIIVDIAIDEPRAFVKLKKSVLFLFQVPVSFEK